MRTSSMYGLALCLALCAASSFAAPSLSVYPIGPNSNGNREWAVDVARDPLLPATSLAVELAFAIDHTDLLGVDVNTFVWDTELPGENPFTGTVTEGLWLDLIGDRTFGAFGSVIITTTDPVRLFTIETAGNDLTTVRYGTAASGDPNKGNLIQDENTRHRYSGSVTIPEPATVVLALMFAGALAGRGRRLFLN